MHNMRLFQVFMVPLWLSWVKENVTQRKHFCLYDVDGDDEDDDDDG